MISKKKFKLYANCIPVKGAKNCIICDLQNQSYVKIPNDLYNILIEYENRSIHEVKAAYKNKYDDIIDQYFGLLVKNDFGFFTNFPESFPKLSTEWKEPFEIYNAIIDLDKSSEYNLNNTLIQLSNLNCKFIQFRFFNFRPLDFVYKILVQLNQIKSNSIGVDFVLPYGEDFTGENLGRLFETHSRISTIRIYGSPFEKEIIRFGTSRYVVYSAKAIISEKDCGMVNKSLFSINIKSYTESLKYNSCLNGKISIDKRGDIKNCPSMKNNYGSINNTPLSGVLLEKKFKKLWGVTKDKIKVCQDCEFRYICTDCRAYIENPKDVLSKPLKCGYNPYNGLWEDWNLKSIDKETLKYYQFNS